LFDESGDGMKNLSLCGWEKTLFSGHQKMKIMLGQTKLQFIVYGMMILAFYLIWRKSHAGFPLGVLKINYYQLKILSKNKNPNKSCQSDRTLGIF
jgi:hypothetical protein